MLQGNSSNHERDFYCLKCFNSSTTKNKLKEHKEICNNHDSCRIEIPKWAAKILKFPPGEKSLKSPFAIYLDLECLLKKEQPRENNNNNNNNNYYLEESYTEKKARHEPPGCAIFTRCSFDKKENKLNYYRGKACIEKLCKKLKERSMKIVNYEEKEMIPLTYEENKSYKEQEACHICKEKFCMYKDDENCKVKDHCHYTEKFRGPAHNKCNLNYKVPKDIPIIIHNGIYDTHFVINQLAEDFKDKLNCKGENMEKYITFSVPIKKKCDNGRTITRKLRFIHSFRFMSASISELLDNMSGIFNNIDCKSCMENIKINLECCFIVLKNNRLIYRCKKCKKEWKRPIEGLLETFPSVYHFCNGHLNRFILLLRNGVYSYDNMDN